MTKQPFGVLILHGLSSSLDCVSCIEPPIKELGLPTRMPVLRGHCAGTPEALRGVKWQDWVADGETALHELLTEAEKAIVFGHSMGAAVALMLAANHPDEIDSLILATPAIALNSPLAPGEPLNFLAPLAVKLLKKHMMIPRYANPELAQYNTNYPWIPSETVATFFELIKTARKRLPEIRQPVYIIQSHKDSTVPEKAGDIIFKQIATPIDQQRRKWFEVTEHEMFRDCERDAAVQAVVDYVRERAHLQQTT